MVYGARILFDDDGWSYRLPSTNIYNLPPNLKITTLHIRLRPPRAQLVLFALKGKKPATMVRFPRGWMLLRYIMCHGES